MNSVPLSSQTLTNLKKMKGPATTLNNVDLVDVLTPEVVAPDDFISREHLVTVLVGGFREESCWGLSLVWKSSRNSENWFAYQRFGIFVS